jgi:hypothetical protein
LTELHRWTRRAVAAGASGGLVLALWLFARARRQRPAGLAGRRKPEALAVAFHAVWGAAAGLTLVLGWWPDLDARDPAGDRADERGLQRLMESRWGAGWTSELAVEDGLDPRWRRDLWKSVREAAGQAKDAETAAGEVAWRLRGQVRITAEGGPPGAWLEGWLERTVTPEQFVELERHARAAVGLHRVDGGVGR